MLVDFEGLTRQYGREAEGVVKRSVRTAGGSSRFSALRPMSLGEPNGLEVSLVSPTATQLADARFDHTHRQGNLTRRALAFILGLEGAYVVIAWAWFMYSMLRLAGCWTAPCFFVVPIDVPQVTQTSAFVAFWASTTFAASVVLWRDSHGRQLQQGWGPRFVLWAALALNLLLAMFFVADLFVIEPASPFEIFLDVVAALFTLVVARLIYMVAARPPFRVASRTADPDPEA
jgi:hypothetical protein